MSFRVFPVEIQHRICSYLCDHCCGEPLADVSGDAERRQALAALSRTNRTLAAIAQPLLYHRITEVKTSQFLALLRTLSECPGFAACVKQYRQLHLTYVGDWSHEKDAFKYALDLRRTLLMNDPAIEEGDEDEDEDEATDGGGGQAAFCNQLLLALMPNLESLALRIEEGDIQYVTTYQHLARRFSRLEGDDPRFPHLHHLQFGTEDRDDGLSMTNAGVIFFLREAPNLRQLIFARTKGSCFFDPTAHVRKFVGALPKFESLRSLEFRDCGIADDDDAYLLFRHLIRSSRVLENFRFTGCRSLSGTELIMRSMHFKLLNELQACKETLRSLDVDFTHQSYWPSEEADEDDYIAQHAESRNLLGEFTRLTTLKIDPELICRHHSTPGSSASSSAEGLVVNIPGSVEEISIRFFGGLKTWADLAKLAGQIALGQYPKLRRVVIYDIDRHNDILTLQRRRETFSKQADTLKEVLSDTPIDLRVEERWYRKKKNYAIGTAGPTVQMLKETMLFDFTDPYLSATF
jgi:hypothetical protein